METLVFIHDKKDLEFIKSNKSFENTSLIALNVNIYRLLQDRNISCSHVEDFYCENKLNRIGNHNYKSVENLCKEIDQLYFSDKNFSCFDIFYYIKVFFDHLLINDFICKGIYKKKKPQKIIILGFHELNPSLVNIGQLDLLLFCIACFFKERGIYCKLYSQKNYKNKLLRVKNVYASMRQALRSLVFRCKRMSFMNTNALISSELVLQNNLNFFNTIVPFIYKKEVELSNKLKNKRIDFSLFSNFTDVDHAFFKAFEIKISNLIFNLSLSCEKYVEKVSYFIETKKINLFISYSEQRLETLMQVKAAKKLGIKTVWLQHGGGFGYLILPIEKYLRRHYSDYIFYTHEINSWIKNRYFKKSEILNNIYLNNRGKS